MKKLKLLFILFLLFAIPATAQYSISVVETTENFGLTSSNAFSTTIYQQKKKDVEKAWTSFMKDQRAKVKSKKGVITALNAAMYQISADTVHAYARFKEAGENEVIAVIGFESKGSFVSSNDDDPRFESSKKVVYDFALKLTKEGLLSNIQKEERVLKKLETEQSILEKDKSRLEYNIEKSKATISKSKEEIIKKTKKFEENKVMLEDGGKKLSELNEMLKTIE